MNPNTLANQSRGTVRAPASSDFSRRDFIKGTVATGVVVGGGLGAFYFGYDKAVGSPVRVGVIGTGDEGSVLLGALNPEFIQVCSIADIRPYNVWRAFHGDHSSDTAIAVRPGLMAKCGWKTEDQARRHLKVYGPWMQLIDNAKADGLEGVIIALPLHLHCEVAIEAMAKGLHVITEKLMGHTVRQCKEMARAAAKENRILAVGHQRHYNVLYASAADSIQRGILGDLHYIRAQWNRSNMPGVGTDSWQQPMPESVKRDDPQAGVLVRKLADCRKQLNAARGAAIDVWAARVAQIKAQIADETVDARQYGYQPPQIRDAADRVVYEGPPIEELIRWRLWDRTGAGLMAELGSHQLDAASIFIHAMHKTYDPKAEKPHPISVCASADRTLFPPDRDVEDHVYCIIEFPAAGYEAKDPAASQKKIGVQYTSLNGNGFGGYGEIVYGTEATLILSKEAELTISPNRASPSSVKVSSGSGGPTLDTQASGAPTAVAKAKGGEAQVSRGYTEELEHWAWCIRHRDPHNQPRCNPKVALGDAVIALTTNIAARHGARIEFKKEWFEIGSDETPEDTAVLSKPAEKA